MKRELYAIGIFTLLLVFIMPMVSAAPPADPKFRAPAYMLSGCDDPLDDAHAECTVGARSGAIVVNPPYPDPDGCGDMAWNISVSFSKLSPNSEYLAALMTHPDADGNTVYDYGSGNIIGIYPSDEYGRVKLKDPFCGTSHRYLIQSQLESGYIVGLIPLVPA